MDQKQKVFQLKNFIASETGRLSSLSVKRDLSLGGNKQKKVYKPNLNVVRNKNKAKIAINNRIQYQHRRNLKSLSNRNQNHQYIQSSGVFSEGAGELRRPKIYSDRYLNYGERDQTTAAMPKVIKSKWVVNTQEEKNVIDELLADDNDDNSSSENDEDYSPVILPLRNNKVGFSKTYQVKKEDLDMQEIKEEIPTSIDNSIQFRNNILNYEIPLSFQDNKFYDDDHPCISLFRMPDTLPGKGFVEDSDKITDFDLGQMTEGKIGKISVKKSGKIELQIGNMRYILDSIETNPFKEDLTYIPGNFKSSAFGPDMVNLGNIDEKYILSPCWKNLFELRNVKKK